jgi:hypothetical protein
MDAVQWSLIHIESIIQHSINKHGSTMVPEASFLVQCWSL